LVSPDKFDALLAYGCQGEQSVTIELHGSTERLGDEKLLFWLMLLCRQ